MTPNGSNAGYPYEQPRSWSEMDAALRRRNVNQSANQPINQPINQSAGFPSQAPRYQGGMYNQSINNNQQDDKLITPKKITSFISTSLSAIKQITTPKSINQSNNQSLNQNGMMTQPFQSSFQFQSNSQPSNGMFTPIKQSSSQLSNQSNFQSQQQPVQPTQSINQLINPSSLSPETLQLVDKWRTAQKFKTDKAYKRSVVLGSCSLIIGVLLGCWTIYRSMSAAINEQSSIVQSICQVILIIGLVTCLAMGGLSIVGFVRYHAVSPNIQSITHRQRKLLGLPYDPELAEQEAPIIRSSNQSKSVMTQSAKKPNVPLFSASKPALNQPSATPSRLLTNQSINQSPVRRELMTEPSQLANAIAHMEREQASMFTPTRPVNQSSYPSVYGSGSINQTSPYQTSLIRSTQSINQSINQPVKFSVEDERSDTESVMLARDLYHRLSINQSIDQWTRSVRDWMARAVIQPLSRDLRASLDQLHSLASQVQMTASISLREEDRAMLRSSRDNEASMIALLCAKFPQHPAVARFVDFHRYTRVSHEGSASESQLIHYTTQRLIALGEDTVLNSIYDWRGGSKFDGMEWNASRAPCDAHILMRAFCAFVDQVYSQFSAQYFVDRAQKSRGHVGGLFGATRKPLVAIHQTRPHIMPPYFMLVVEENGHSNEWRIEPGKQNLFQVIAVFVWFVRERSNGRLGGLRIEDRGLADLANVID